MQYALEYAYKITKGSAYIITLCTITSLCKIETMSSLASCCKYVRIRKFEFVARLDIALLKIGFSCSHHLDFIYIYQTIIGLINQFNFDFLFIPVNLKVV